MRQVLRSSPLEMCAVRDFVRRGVRGESVVVGSTYKRTS